MTHFNPKDHLIDLRGKKYLDVRNRLVWFRHEHPQGSVQTQIISAAPPIVKASIYDNEGVLIATGHGTANAPKNGSTVVWSGREIEKAETAAIGRALGHAGYGTEDAMHYVVKSIAASTTVEEKKARLGAGTNRNLTGGANGQHANSEQVDLALVNPDPPSEVVENPQNATDPLVAPKTGNSQSPVNSKKGYKEHDLWNAILKPVYGNNPIHMKKSLKKLDEAGLLGQWLTLEEAIEVVKNRHNEPTKDIPA